jgi:4'-phosphopantetheinyl transferase
MQASFMVRGLVRPRAILSQMFPDSSAPAADVHAFIADVRVLDDGARHARALARLGDADRGRYDRFRVEIDREMFLLGRVMARALVGRALGVDPQAWRWSENARGRPEIADPPTDLRFNLSHSAGLVACAIARGRDVGVDVESLRRRPIDPAIVRRYCSPAECADIETYGDGWQRRFLVYWTLKEAYLKARGVGVALPLAEISFAPDPPARLALTGSLAGTSTAWQFALAQPTPDHIAAVAVDVVDGARASIAFDPFPADLLP